MADDLVSLKYLTVMENDHFVYPSRAPEVVRSAGLLIDMDGTIIDSTNAIVKYCAWSWATISGAAELGSS